MITISHRSQSCNSARVCCFWLSMFAPWRFSQITVTPSCKEIPVNIRLSPIFFFPCNPPSPQADQPPPAVPPERAKFFGQFRLHFGSVWLRFGSVSGPFSWGPFRGVGWGRGGVGERGFCKGKDYHYTIVSKIIARLIPQTFFAVISPSRITEVTLTPTFAVP